MALHGVLGAATTLGPRVAPRGQPIHGRADVRGPYGIDAEMQFGEECGEFAEIGAAALSVSGLLLTRYSSRKLRMSMGLNSLG